MFFHFSSPIKFQSKLIVIGNYYLLVTWCPARSESDVICVIWFNVYLCLVHKTYHHKWVWLANINKSRNCCIILWWQYLQFKRGKTIPGSLQGAYSGVITWTSCSEAASRMLTKGARSQPLKMQQRLSLQEDIAPTWAIRIKRWQN